MAVKKLSRKELPSGHTLNDFECFGPPALKDGQFDDTMIADFGCFNQDGKDSNKFYHAAVVKSKVNGTWYVYLQWGRTGTTGDIQFWECGSKEEAARAYVKQCESKNVRRGVFKDIGGRQVLCGKPGKDCYRVRPAAKRDVGLPDAKNIVHKDTDATADDGKTTTASKKKTKKKTSRKPKPKFDANTLQLMHAMNQGAVNYTRASIEGGHIPTQAAIDEARDLLDAAQQRVGKVGDNADDQKGDTELVEITNAVYGLIPKTKRIGDENWILGSNNIVGWRSDLDAYENALVAVNIGDDATEVVQDPFDGARIEMKHMTADTREGDFIKKWLPKATANRHGHVGTMRILNMWAFRQVDLMPRFDQMLETFKSRRLGTIERPAFQPDARHDLSATDQKKFHKTNTSLLFHGTRSVNVPGILREGLRMPKQLVGVAITGAMFGPGSYFADDWKKSDGYTSRPGTYWARGGGHVQGRGAFMFLADVVVGKPFVAPGPRGYTSPPKGCDSIAGLRGKSGVQNNEWITFDTSNINLRYLVEYEA